MTLTAMKKVIKPISRIVRNIFRMIRDIFSSKTRFFRISPYAKGEIFFFDKKNIVFFLYSPEEKVIHLFLMQYFLSIVIA